MFCTKCGNVINEEDKFCGKCGNNVRYIENQKDNKEHDKKKSKKINKKFIYIIIGVSIVTVGTLILLNNIRSTNTKDNIKNNTNSNLQTNGNVQINTTKELSIDDIQIGKEFRSISEMNDITSKVINCAWQRIQEGSPNAKWNYVEIKKEDGCGRYLVFFNYIKSSISENASMDNVIVWIKDIENNNMGYYTSSEHMTVLLKEWGTPLK